MAAPATKTEILDVNRRYHDVAADSYDAKWGISFGIGGQEQVTGKLAKRGISLKSVEVKEPDLSPLGHARQVIKIKQGIEPAVAKEVSQFIRGLGLKVTAAIQGDELRVTGKSRDDLQAVIGACQTKEFKVALQFENFRD